MSITIIYEPFDGLKSQYGRFDSTRGHSLSSINQYPADVFAHVLDRGQHHGLYIKYKNEGVVQINMQEANLAFLLQQRVGSEGKITVPREVRELLFTDPESTENLYIWHYDQEDDYIIISNKVFDENQSSPIHSSPAQNNPRRTTIPGKVRDEFDLEEDDDLYFVTPEAVKSGTPAVFVWTFEQIEEIIIGGAEKVESGFPRQPHF